MEINKILDKGFVKLIDHLGNDDAIVQAARVSYSKGTKTKREDDKLIAYLLKNQHWSPFEMVVFKFHIKCPLFVARQWMRHRAGSYNEISARYSEVKEEFYIPSLNRIEKQSTKNKQGSEIGLDIDKKILAYNLIMESSQKSFDEYEKLLNLGISRELARIILPLNLYTEFYWKVDLRNLLNFIKLRSHEHAQEEIRQYSDFIFNIIEEIVPETCKNFKIVV